MKRIQYLIALLISHALASILYTLSLSQKLGTPTESNGITSEIISIYIFIVLAGAVMPVVATWSRLLDAGRSKYLSFLILIPIISLYPLFVGLFTPTQQNRI
jgi:uncharacterized membrane protein YhaH (DUF805 family)